MIDPELDPADMPGDELLAYLRSHPVVTLWPFAGRTLGLSRSATYCCPQIKVLRLGHLCRVSSVWLEALLLGERSANCDG
jgi:hypothetical protein